MIINDLLLQLAVGVFSFVLTTVVMAFFMAAVLQAIYDVGLRHLLQRRWVYLWLLQREERLRKHVAAKSSNNSETEPAADRALAEIVSDRQKGSIFSLPPAQLCGQISALANLALDGGVNSDLVKLLVQAGTWNSLPESQSPGSPSSLSPELKENDFESRTNLASAERALDDLQITLAQRWKILDYKMGLSLAALLALVVSSGRSIGFIANISLLPVYGSVILFSVILMPQMRSIVERLTRFRY